MKMTKTTYVLAYILVLTLVGCASYQIMNWRDKAPEPEITPRVDTANLKPLPPEDPHLRLGDMAICTACGYTHNCQDWKEFCQDMHYEMYGCPDPNCYSNHNEDVEIEDIIDDIEDDFDFDQPEGRIPLNMSPTEQNLFESKKEE